jgi:hypothetical protein
VLGLRRIGSPSSVTLSAVRSLTSTFNFAARTSLDERVLCLAPPTFTERGQSQNVKVGARIELSGLPILSMQVVVKLRRRRLARLVLSTGEHRVRREDEGELGASANQCAVVTRSWPVLVGCHWGA